MTSKTADRIPVTAMEQIIHAALEGLDFSHDTIWRRPESCACHALGQSCESPQAVRCSCDTRHLTASERELLCRGGGEGQRSCDSKLAEVPGSFRCQGHTAEVDTPPEHVVNLDIMVAALPEPDNDGTLDMAEAGNSILSVIEERLRYPYSLRARHLVSRLAEQAEQYELAHGGAVSDVSLSPGYSPKCMHCGAPIPAERGPRAKFCKPSHRVAAAKRKRAARVAAEAGRALPVTFPGRCPASSPACWSGGRERPPDQHRITRVSGPASLPAGLPATGPA
jgi:hypothetical protein